MNDGRRCGRNAGFHVGISLWGNRDAAQLPQAHPINKLTSMGRAIASHILGHGLLAHEEHQAHIKTVDDFGISPTIWGASEGPVRSRRKITRDKDVVLPRALS